MLAVCRLVGIEKTVGDKVISKSRFYNTFDYFGYERQVNDFTSKRRRQKFLQVN